MNFDRLIKIMEDLRSEDGCPWDREQTRESLKPFLIDEAYELLEALDEHSPGKIKEELGDLLFQIIFHAQIAKERGEFDINDIIETVSQKLVVRHPHVFGEIKLKTAEEVVGRWEEHKRKEGKLRESILEGIQRSLPSLLKAYKVQERASRVGFDWKKTEEVLKKLEEEFEEFRNAVKTGGQSEIEDELGDLFFSLVNVARFVGVNPDEALHKTIMKFIQRFRYIEAKASDEGRVLSKYSIEEMDTLWEEAKNKA